MYFQNIINVIEVFIAYFLLIIVFTAFMIKPIVRKHNLFKRFISYICVGNFYVMNVVFALAYINMFNRIALIVTFITTSLIIRILLDKKDAKRIYTESKETFRHLLFGEYGKKVFIINKLTLIKAYLKAGIEELFNNKKIEWLVFLLIIGYNIYYYGINKMNFVSYSAPDEEVHLYWIQSLIGGNIFPKGIYPHGFHNVIAAISVFFGFDAVTVVRSFGIISTVLIMTMLYFGVRKVLKSKYAALLGMAAYSLLNIYEIQSVYRYQFSIPQEYGMIMLMPIAIFLFAYLKDKKKLDLVLVGISLSMTISIHFYVTIIAIVLLISIVIVYIYRIIVNRLFIKLILCGLAAVMIAIAPLATAYAMGHRMEQSMAWATSVIQGNEYDDNEEESSNVDQQSSEEIVKTDVPLTWDTFKIDTKNAMVKYVFTDIKVFYLFMALLGITIIYCILLMILRKKSEEILYQLVFAVCGFILIFLILCLPLGLPTVMEPKRVAIFLAYFSPIFMAMPFEILYGISGKGIWKKVCSLATFLLIPGLILFLVNYNLLRPLPPFYYFQTKGAMLVDCNIIQNYKDYKWTVVSPVNDLSVIYNNGYHYELSEFILKQENWNKDIEIKIPTKYVFIYIEKRPIVNYGFRFYNDDEALVNRQMVNYEKAKSTFKNDAETIYTDDRSILMSKAYFWAQEYKKYFPEEMNVYYEDDEIIVYRIEQNEYALNNFSINYGANEGK